MIGLVVFRELQAVSDRGYILKNARSALLLPESSATWHAHSAFVVHLGAALAGVELREKAVVAATAKVETPSSVKMFFMIITFNKSRLCPRLVGFAPCQTCSTMQRSHLQTRALFHVFSVLVFRSATIGLFSDNPTETSLSRLSQTIIPISGRLHAVHALMA
jgi:hypothetical protein